MMERWRDFTRAQRLLRFGISGGADNVELDAGSGGALVATDDDGTAHHQYVKVEFGADNTQTKVTSTVGLPVSLVSTDAAVTSLAILDDWDESDRAKVNLIVGQAGIAAGAGAVGATVPGDLDTVMFYGTWGSATAVLQGTNESAASPTAAIALTVDGSSALSLTADGMKVVHENPLKVRPVLSGGTGSSVTVVAKCRIRG